MMYKNFIPFNIWISSGIVFLVILFIVAISYHSIFKPDYRPGYSSIPFIWYPLLSSWYKKSRKSYLLSSYYNVQALSGMCKIVENQKILSFNILGSVWVFLFTPEAAEVILGSSTLIEKSSDYKAARILLRDGLLTSKDEKWKQRRKLLTPTFHFKILQNYTSLLQDTCKCIVEELEKIVNEPWVEVGRIMKRFCAIMLLKTVMGIDLNLSKEEMDTLIDNANEFQLCFNTRLSRPWLSSDILFKMSPLCERSHKAANACHSFLRKVIKEKKKKILATKNRISENGISICNGNAGKKENDLNSKQRRPFLDLLLDLHFKDSSFTEEDILDETVPFFGGGSVTLGTAITYILYCIGLYPEVQKNICNELEEIFQGSNRDMNEDDLRSMKYLECVIKEGLRLYSMPFISRTATEDFKVFDHTVPKGSTVVIFNYVIQRNPEIYPLPEKFDPSRFYPENCVGRHPYAFLPFSAGPRNCIGQKFANLETKTVIAAILRNFEIYSLDDRDRIYDMSKIDATETDVPVRIRFSLRNKVKQL